MFKIQQYTSAVKPQLHLRCQAKRAMQSRCNSADGQLAWNPISTIVFFKVRTTSIGVHRLKAKLHTWQCADGLLQLDRKAVLILLGWQNMLRIVLVATRFNCQQPRGKNPPQEQWPGVLWPFNTDLICGNQHLELLRTKHSDNDYHWLIIITANQNTFRGQNRILLESPVVGGGRNKESRVLLPTSEVQDVLWTWTLGRVTSPWLS